MSSTHLGVDFGTSHTVAVLDRDGAAVPLLFDSSPLLPSAVYAEPGARLLVGAEARNAARLEPARYEPHPKRRVDDGRVLLGEDEFTVEELFAAVLSRVRQGCESVLGAVPSSVTLTHPAGWGSARRLVLEDAATAAGFAAARLVPEPVAAAGYFTRVLRHGVPAGHGILVADLGGGTFDASVVADSPGGFQVLAVDGIDDLGGVDIDHALVGLLGERFADRPQWTRLTKPETVAERRARRAWYEEVRGAKELLSRRSRVELPVPLLDSDTHVTREELERLTRPLLERAVRLATAVARASRLGDRRLSGALLVGGASRMPLVASLLHQALGTAPVVLEQPELVVAQGATLTEARSVAGDPVGVVPMDAAPQQPGPDAMTATAAETAPPANRSETPPRSVRTARTLMWISGATVLLWIFSYLITLDHFDAATIPNGNHDQLLFRLSVLPIGIALSMAVMLLAPALVSRRSRIIRRSALTANAVTAVVAVLMAYISVQLPGEVRGPLTVATAILQTGLGAAAIALLLSPSAARFMPPPVTAAARAVPIPVRIAQALLGITAAAGAFFAVYCGTAFAQAAVTQNTDLSRYSVNGSAVFLVTVTPLLLIAVATLAGLTAIRLTGWHLAVAAAAATAFSHLATLIGTAELLGDTTSSALLAVTAAMGACGAVFLLLPSSRSAFGTTD